MPWRQQAMKDVAACDKPRGAGKRALIRGCPNGETRRALNRLSREQSERKSYLPQTLRREQEGAVEPIESASLLAEFIGRVERTR